MSAISFAKQAFGREKPHSSITDWVEILTGSSYEEEAYDGIPELVDSINLQGAGTTEASRALRKKLKHGGPHQQYRAMVLLKALVENCGHKFQASFADDMLTDALKQITADPSGDPRVKKKVLLVLASWEQQYKSDPQMAHVAGLYRQCKQHRITQQQTIDNVVTSLGLPNQESEATRRKRAKKEAKEAKEKERQQKEEERLRQNRPRRPAFDFEKDKPKVLSSIVEASQATSNLINAIVLVNTEKDSISTNERVQECLEKAKVARKPVVRYIQLVENEELIGTLIETNERIIGALEMYDQLCLAEKQPPAADETAANEVAPQMTGESEVFKLQEKQRAAIKRAKQVDNSNVHPDLQDLNFGAIGGSAANLPPPMKPSGQGEDGSDEEPYNFRGSLSDFSDYVSSDEETHNASSSRRPRKDYVDVSDDPDVEATVAIRPQAGQDDPFADPFADEVAIGPTKR